MDFKTKRCRHCGKLYNYQASGDGCFSETNDKEYCPECKAVINNALKTVPKRFESRYKEIECKDDLLKALENIKEKNKMGKGHVLSNFVIMTQCTNALDYDNIETYNFLSNSYALCWNDGTTEEKHLFLLMEYDLLEDKFTETQSKNEYGNDYTSYASAINLHKWLKKMQNNAFGTIADDVEYGIKDFNISNGSQYNCCKQLSKQPNEQ